MAGFCENLQERDSFAATPIYPASNSGTQGTGAVDMSKFNRVQFLWGVGTVGANASVQFYLAQTNDSTGASGVNLTSSSPTNISVAGNVGSIEVQAEQLTARYVVCNAVVTVNACVLSVFPYGTMARYQPANTYDYNTTRVQRTVVPNQ